ncbi:Acetyltransferase (GNAT) family protein [Falsiruegeria litorea R37]|uniref:Acetyltransferase (GNAT) family protein n=1 Tax=Falsiruegeria litorea R37 TaxID=1200284 RepID=A0A1Y5S4X9_9RHOB|nr:GNAT family N-acetyltransferase [Falsiruegeria litorea]SLN31408.1 Acetyltransferase (GNAT) family protein [Falsiruegeria litorea R37]
MIVRPLVPDEAHRLLPLLHQVHSLHVEHQPERYPPLKDDVETLDWLAGWLRGQNMHCLVAEDDERLCGYAIYEIEHRPAMPVRHAETRGMLHQISVDAAHRRQGIGRALINAMRARLAQEKIGIIATTYASFNTASARLMADAGLAPKTVYAEWRG